MRLIFTILFLCSFAAFSQLKVKKQFPITWEKNDLKVISFQFINGSANGISDAIQFHGIGKGNSWVDFSTSWKNKYRNYDAGDMRAAYFWSKTIFVAGTDAFHALRAIQRSTNTITIIIDRTDYRSWKKILQKTIVIYLSNRAGFHLFYDQIFAH